MSLAHLTDRIFRQAIDAQELEFDSHSIIRYFYERHQSAYVLELASRAGAVAYPVTETHRMIGLELLRYDELISKIDERSSVTIGGEERPCAVWRKR